MPESEAAEGPTLRERFEALETAVARLLSERDELQRKARRLEVMERELREAMDDEQLDALDPARIEDRLRELSEENRRLREIVEEGRERAERLRSRLIMLEDEA